MVLTRGEKLGRDSPTGPQGDAENLRGVPVWTLSLFPASAPAKQSCRADVSPLL